MYLMTYVCNTFYVGKIKRPLFKHMYDHVYLTNVNMTMSISQNVELHYNFDTSII